MKSNDPNLTDNCSSNSVKKTSSEPSTSNSDISKNTTLNQNSFDIIKTTQKSLQLTCPIPTVRLLKMCVSSDEESSKEDFLTETDISINDIPGDSSRNSSKKMAKLRFNFRDSLQINDNESLRKIRPPKTGKKKSKKEKKKERKLRKALEKSPKKKTVEDELSDIVKKIKGVKVDNQENRKSKKVRKVKKDTKQGNDGETMSLKLNSVVQKDGKVTMDIEDYNKLVQFNKILKTDENDVFKYREESKYRESAKLEKITKKKKLKKKKKHKSVMMSIAEVINISAHPNHSMRKLIKVD